MVQQGVELPTLGFGAKCLNHSAMGVVLFLVIHARRHANLVMTLDDNSSLNTFQHITFIFSTSGWECEDLWSDEDKTLSGAF